MIKPVIIIAQLFIAFILFLFRILLSIGHVLWKMVIWILLFIWKVFLACSIYCFAHMETSPNRVKLFIVKHIGFLQYIAKLKGHIFQLWEHIKRS